MVEPLDALIVINDVNANGVRQIGSEPAQDRHSVDADNDGSVTPLDVLVVINLLNRFAGPHELSASMPESDLDGNGVVLSPTIKIEGITSANSKLSASITGSSIVATVQADDFGRYKMELPLGFGKSLVSLQSTDPLGRTALSTMCQK